MPTSLEEQIGPDRFCIKPHVGGLGSALFHLAPEWASYSYLGLEVCEGVENGRKLRLGRHLVKEFQAPHPGAASDGVLELIHACQATSEGFIEPSGETRLL